jgi:hypothetical protein
VFVYGSVGAGVGCGSGFGMRGGMRPPVSCPGVFQPSLTFGLTCGKAGLVGAGADGACCPCGKAGDVPLDPMGSISRPLRADSVRARTSNAGESVPVETLAASAAGAVGELGVVGC